MNNFGLCGLITIGAKVCFSAYLGAIFEKKALGEKALILNLFSKVEELTRRLEQSEQQIRFLHEENQVLKKENAELRTENAQLKTDIEILRTQNVSLKAEVTELRARIDSNSQNSNKPPSSDGYKKNTVKPAFPKAKGNKQGGQQGHKGHTMQQVSTPDIIVTCKPEQCGCGHRFSQDTPVLAEKRQVFDLSQPKLDVTEYQIFKISCPCCGLEHKGLAPEGVNAPVQYGNNVKAFAVLLNVHYKLPFKKIQLLFRDLFGYAINESTIIAAGEKCYQQLQESENIIKSAILSSKVAHADESGARVEGRLHWLHATVTRLHTYLFFHPKRGTGAIQSNESILMDYIGWLVHDCWGSYFNLSKPSHAICGAHILRELQGLADLGDIKWAKVFKAFLLSVYTLPFQERVKRRHLIESRYDRICGLAEMAEPPPVKTSRGRGKFKRTKGRNLVERLIREKHGLLAFAFNKDVPFTNNLAERDIRPVKIKLKISNCFRTFRGAEVYARIEGFISTARKHNRGVFTELSNTFDGYNFITG
jgi:transposase